MQCEEINENDKIVKNEERDWASFRGQTLSRTGKLYRWIIPVIWFCIEWPPHLKDENVRLE